MLENPGKSSLHSIDKKGGGREIANLPPKQERFSSLLLGRDIVDMKRNKEIVSDIDLDSLYVFLNPSQGTESLQVEAPHWRTVSKEGIVARFESEKGQQVYYTANIKGVGYLKPTLRGQSIDDWDDWNRIDEYEYEQGFGLAGKDDFYSNEGDLVLKSQWLTNKGFRTELYSSFGRLKNVFYKGEHTSVEELRNQGIIPSQKKFIPHIGVRLLKINNRIAEVKDTDPVRAQELFTKAFDVFNQESLDTHLEYPKIEKGNTASEKLFFKVFFERMGKNMAIFQNIGYIGWHLHSANTTLAAEIVDIGPYESWEQCEGDEEFIKKYQGIRRGTWKDLRDIAYTLKYLLQGAQNAGVASPVPGDLVSIFLEKFEEGLDEQELQEQEISKDQLLDSARRVLSAVLVEGKRLPALKHGNDITDWNVLE